MSFSTAFRVALNGVVLILRGARDFFLGLRFLCVRNDKLDAERFSRMRKTVAQCCGVNFVFWISLLVFYEGVIPLVMRLTSYGTSSMVGSVVVDIIGWIFGALWLLPIYVMTRLINTHWFQVVFSSINALSESISSSQNSTVRPTSSKHSVPGAKRPPHKMPSIATMAADFVFSIVMEMLFLLQGQLTTLLPLGFVSVLSAQLHACVLCALYAFEYKWFTNGLTVNERTRMVESQWPYYLGFGLPLSLASFLTPSHVLSGCIFAMLFPVMIISAQLASPPPGRFEYPLPLFKLVTSLTSSIFAVCGRILPTVLSSGTRLLARPQK